MLLTHPDRIVTGTLYTLRAASKVQFLQRSRTRLQGVIITKKILFIHRSTDLNVLTIPMIRFSFLRSAGEKS